MPSFLKLPLSLEWATITSFLMQNQANNPQLYPLIYDDTKYTGNAPCIAKYNLCSALSPEKADSLRNIGEEVKRQRCLEHLLYASTLLELYIIYKFINYIGDKPTKW